ncbi:MAG: glutaredoxin domain-containing protein [Candidatus Micrarchaeota archaeon]
MLLKLKLPIFLRGELTTIKLYTSPTCLYCKMLKNFLIANNVQFEEIDVSSNPELAKEIAEKSGQLGLPVMDIDGKILAGFDRKAIKEALGLP